MKKNLFKKGVAMLGAISLLANVLIPGLEAFANNPNQSEGNYTWEYIYSEDSWNDSYQNGILKTYYTIADAASPYREDLWNTVENRAANWNDIVKENDVPVYNTGLQGYEYPNCVRNWSGAISAPLAKYPWIAVNLPKPFAGKIKFVYDNGAPVYYGGNTDDRAFRNGYAIESIPTLFGDQYKLIDGKTTFDPSKLVVSLIPIDPVSSASFDYIWNEETFNTAYYKSNSKLKAYYDNNPSEDLWNTSENRKCEDYDIDNKYEIYSDSQGNTLLYSGFFTPRWGYDYWELTNKDTSESTYNKYYVNKSPSTMGNGIYELYSQITCVVPEGATGWVPDTYKNLYYDCNYLAPGIMDGSECTPPEGYSLPAGVTNGQMTVEHEGYSCWYITDGAYDATSAGKYVKFGSLTYPSACVHSWSGTDKSKFPWAVATLPTPFAGTINATYGDTTKHPGGENQIFSNGYAIIGIPENFGDEYALNNGVSTFTKDNLSISLSQILQSETSVNSGYYKVTCGDNEKPILGGTACEVIPLVETPTAGTTGSGSSISNFSMNTIEIVNTGDDIQTGAADKVVLVQSSNPSSTDENNESGLELALNGVVEDKSKVTDLEGLVDLEFIKVETDGDKIPLGPITFNKAIKVKIKVSKSGVRVKVKHGSGKYGYDLLAKNSTTDCANLSGSDNAYTGSLLNMDNSGFVEIWTCGASTFVAYTEKTKTSGGGSGSGGSGSSGGSTGGSGGGGGGGSSSSSSSKVITNKTGDNEVLTGDVSTENKSNTNEVKSETKKEVVISDNAKETYSEEQLEAYKWAYENGITTINDADKARLSDPLTRAELAKMMSQYISSVLKKSPAMNGVPVYNDVDDSLGDLAGYIVKAYQYQIMGINADGSALTGFNPYGLVTRGEFATVFSRVLFGSKYNQSESEGAFYEKHLAALKEAGILSNDTPTIEEVRGWVMLMMYRSAKTTEKTDSEPVKEETKAEEGTGVIAGIANPASVYCVEQGGEIEIREDTDGGQYGVCKFKDGTEVEEWKYYRENALNNSGATAETSTGSVAAETGAVAETGTVENN